MNKLPAPFAEWFRKRGWAPHLHQLTMLQAAHDGEHTLLIAPTGGDKTLAGFLPSMIELANAPDAGQPQSQNSVCRYWRSPVREIHPTVNVSVNARNRFIFYSPLQSLWHCCCHMRVLTSCSASFDTSSLTRFMQWLGTSVATCCRLA